MFGTKQWEWKRDYAALNWVEYGAIVALGYAAYVTNRDTVPTQVIQAEVITSMIAAGSTMFIVYADGVKKAIANLENRVQTSS